MRRDGIDAAEKSVALGLKGRLDQGDEPRGARPREGAETVKDSTLYLQNTSAL